MKRLPFLRSCLLLATALTVPAQTLDQSLELYSTNSQHGINHLSARGWPGKPGVSTLYGSTNGNDGRLTTASASSNQFTGVLTYGGLVAPTNRPTAGTTLSGGYAANAATLGLPRGSNAVLRSAHIGAPVFAQAASYAFGSVVAPPGTDENGNALTTVAPAAYWWPEPVTNSPWAARGFYFSPHARQVFAQSLGTMQITWRRTDPSTVSGTNKVTLAGQDYAVLSRSYTVAGVPAKPPRNLYWTQAPFNATAQFVAVPAGSVGQVHFVYTDAFPANVPTNQAFSDPSNGGTTYPETRTAWYDSISGINAFNLEGRVFLELLGDVTPSGTRVFLGCEIVEVHKTAAPLAVAVNIGDMLKAYPDGSSDADLSPSPITSGGTTPFIEQDYSGNSARPQYYAIKLTHNPNDVQVYWLETGVAGIKWPRLFNAYQQTWPQSPALYSYYLRPPAASAGEAALTAVQLPANNNPLIVYEEELGAPRSFLTSSNTFYTVMSGTDGVTQMRTLLKYNTGNLVAYERVLSTLSTAVASRFATNGTAPLDVPNVVQPVADRGSALVLDGTGYGQLPAGNYFNGGSFTIESWVNVPSYPNFARLMDFGNGPGINTVVVPLTSGTSGYPFFGIYPTSTNSGGITSGQIVTLNQWTHLAAVYDATQHTMSLFLNGINVASTAFTNPPANNLTTTNNYVGKSEWGGDALAQGSLDNFRIWNTALTTNQLQTGMATGAYPAGTAGLVVQFTFDESGSVAYDTSGNHHDMTLIGGARSTISGLPANTAPRYLTQQAFVGARILPPAGETGSDGVSYLAGWIRTNRSTAYHNTAYQDPFLVGFSAANAGAIIPINAIPDNNVLEVWWMRVNPTNTIRNPVNGFEPVYWPAVIANYTLAYPYDPASRIILADNAGSGGLASLQAKGTIYTQNDPTLPGYNPNEEHAVMIGGQAYALRDDLNVTAAGSHFTSYPYVLLSYTESDNRPAVRAFSVTREDRAAGKVFDYVVEAGQQIQAPMPLPVLAPPVETLPSYVYRTTGNPQRTNESFTYPTAASGTVFATNYTATNYNREVTLGGRDLPTRWNSASESTGPYAAYTNFSYLDRKNVLWAMRGFHAGLPALAAGTANFTNTDQVVTTNLVPKYCSGWSSTYYCGTTEVYTTNYSLSLKSGTFSSMVVGGPINVPCTNYVHCSRRIDSLTLSTSPANALPAGVVFDKLPNGLAVYGTWTSTNTSSYTLLLADDDGAQTSVSFIWKGQNKPTQAALNINDLIGRPPELATAAAGSNSIALQFYYQNQESFAWPGVAEADKPAEKAIIPYLRPYTNGSYLGAGQTSADPALAIIYRPVWPSHTPTLAYGETLTVASKGRPAIRGQTSANVLYQQAIALATNSNRGTQTAVILNDPTRKKTFALEAAEGSAAPSGLSQLPVSVYTQGSQGKTYFPNLPPHLAQRFYLDPTIGAKGSLVFQGQFMDEPTGEKYLHLNILAGSDLATVKKLCTDADPDKAHWDEAVENLTARVETFVVSTNIPGKFVVDPNRTVIRSTEELVAVTNANTAVDSYALSAAGPGQGYLTLIVGDGAAFTPPGEPVSIYVMRVTGDLYRGEVKIIPADNPLSEFVTFEHTGDLAGKTEEYAYEWKLAPPVDGLPPLTDDTMSRYQPLVEGEDLRLYTMGAAGVASLADNYLVMRYSPVNTNHPLYGRWSDWTAPALSEGYVKRALGGINPFNQRTDDLNSDAPNAGASLLTQAGKRYEGDIALNQANLNNYGLIEIYETVLNRARNLSINAGINYGPANDSLLLAAGYISDLYKSVGDEAYADADNPTIGIGTSDSTYGSIATSLFSFKGQVSTLLDEEMALLRGRDDTLQPGVTTAPVYNRLVWNYTGGIDSGEVIYRLNYNILDKDLNGSADAADAAILYPQGHGDAYGHYLTANKVYHALLLNRNFDWVPRIQAVNVLGLAVSVGYMDERKFAATAAAVGRTGRQIFDLVWRQTYNPDPAAGWDSFDTTRTSARTVTDAGVTVPIVRQWGMDQWAARTGQGALLNWVLGNAILPDVDPDSSHEGIQKVDRTTVPELNELVSNASELQASMDNAEGRLSPLGVSANSVALDIEADPILSPLKKGHFEQVYDRAVGVLKNAVVAFDDAKNVTQQMRQEENNLQDLSYQQQEQELTFTHALIELYGTPYADDMGPGRTYTGDYTGPDLYHSTYVDLRERTFGDYLQPTNTVEFHLDVQDFPADWKVGLENQVSRMDFINSGYDENHPGDRSSTQYITYTLDPAGYVGKPPAWTGRRATIGAVQEAISTQIASRNRVYQTMFEAEEAKGKLDEVANTIRQKVQSAMTIDGLEGSALTLEAVVQNLERLMESYIFQADNQWTIFEANSKLIEAPTDPTAQAPAALGTTPGSVVATVAKVMIVAPKAAAVAALAAAHLVYVQAIVGTSAALDTSITAFKLAAKGVERTQEDLEQLNEFDAALRELHATSFAVNDAIEKYGTDAAKVNQVLKRGERILEQRDLARRRQADVIQGISSRNAAFRLFRNEKLERYKVLFDLAARYGLLAANAYDYETGLLGTDQGRSFVSRFVNSRALGVVVNGQPQYAGSDTGDPGLSSALAEMKADFDIVKGRLSLNSPNVDTTDASLRSGNLRILPGTNGVAVWQDYLQQHRVDNILDDMDVRRMCLQADPGNGLPVPGIVITFSTSINSGENLFGKPLAAGDNAFHRSYFATKLHSVGVVLEGYRGMNYPGANGTVDPNLGFLDPNALAADPYVYLIPVGMDVMRTPPLGDTSTLRQWSVEDVAIPLPFNIGGSPNSALNFYQSADSLAEPLFTARKHPAFRPTDSVAPFANEPVFPNGGYVGLSQRTSRRLIGRSVWNTQWKLVIPGDTLLADPKEGLDRFIKSVTDVKLHFSTYSYSGN